MFRLSIIPNVLKKTLIFLSSTLPLMLLSRSALADEPVDYLAKTGALKSMILNFGKNSTFYWIIVGASLVYCLFEYFFSKTHKRDVSVFIMPLIGIAAFSVFWLMIPSS